MIRVSEAFYSIQGEGRHVGKPSVFLRVFGCNFRCKNFNRPKNEVIEGHNPDVIQIINQIDNYTTNQDLPIVNSGCDSYMSIYPEFKRFTTDYDVEPLADYLASLIPSGLFYGVDLVVTGGEPLLGWQKQYPQLFGILKEKYGLSRITFETNGTQELQSSLSQWIDNTSIKVHFSVSVKLPNSGEKWEDAVKPNIIAKYSVYGITDLKFVVEDTNDFGDIVKAIDELSRSINGEIYLMPQGGTTGTYQNNAKKIALLAMDLGLSFSPRLQCDLFNNEWST